jgi:hypothetical protein
MALLAVILLVSRMEWWPSGQNSNIPIGGSPLLVFLGVLVSDLLQALEKFIRGQALGRHL